MRATTIVATFLLKNYFRPGEGGQGGNDIRQAELHDRVRKIFKKSARIFPKDVVD
jgi:hypothetical protein